MCKHININTVTDNDDVDSAYTAAFKTTDWRKQEILMILED